MAVRDVRGGQTGSGTLRETRQQDLCRTAYWLLRRNELSHDGNCGREANEAIAQCGTPSRAAGALPAHRMATGLMIGWTPRVILGWPSTNRNSHALSSRSCCVF